MRIDIDMAYETSPEEIAVEFANATSEWQAEFFNALFREVKAWEHPFAFQLQAITDEPELTDGARAVMDAIGKYSTKTI